MLIFGVEGGILMIRVHLFFHFGGEFEVFEFPVLISGFEPDAGGVDSSIC